MEKFVAVVIANPKSGEENSYISHTDRIEIERDGTMVIYTDDDSTCTYLSDEWLRLEPIRD